MYVLNQSIIEVKKAYGNLIDKVNDHVKLLAENGKPITSLMGVKRGLLKLNIGYLEPGNNEEVILGQEESKLVNEILETMQIDVKQAVDVGLIGIREMKRELVKFHYEKMAKDGKTYKEIKQELSKKYGLSNPESKCRFCGGQLANVQPPKFSPIDKYQKYRLQYFKEEFDKKNKKS